MEVSFEGCPPIYRGRVSSFKYFATEIMKKVNPVCVEIGCLRRKLSDPSVGDDGGSTPIFAWAVNKAGGTLDCCDINEIAVLMSREGLKTYGLLNDKINIHHRDGIEFVKEFPYSIDVIYIDGMDFGVEIRERSMDWHLEMFKAAEPRIRE